MLLLDSAYNLARFLSRDAGAAEQIAHAAFHQVRRESAMGRNERAELLKNVRRCYQTWLSTLRQKGRTAPHSFSNAVSNSAFISGDGSESLTVSADINVGTFRFAIEAMPRRLREILVLKDLEKLSYGEISAVTSLRTAQVMWRLARARRMLARSLSLSEPRSHPAAPVTSNGEEARHECRQDFTGAGGL